MKNERVTRHEMLADGVLAVGTRWAQGWRDDMVREGRPIAGGWPGTLPEARARISAHLCPELAGRQMPLLTAEELGWTARATYQKAKGDWLATPSRKQARSHRSTPEI